MNQVLSENGSMENPDNSPRWRKFLVSHRAALIQQAEALLQQRRAILSEVGDIEKELENEKHETII